MGVHLIDGSIKTCHMKVRTEVGEDTDLVYKNAQKFVSMVAKFRTRVDPPKTYCCWFPVPNFYTPYRAPTFGIKAPPRPLFYTENDRKMYEIRLQAEAEAHMKYGAAGDALNLVLPVLRPVLKMIFPEGAELASEE